ncbi:CRP-like cAMP-activated global transcriptional regulator [bioreactor metagenome]|uniref:CRP/FNR family transcriptional regulator n=2 Tax=root TaxID=1 RepID=A0A562JKA6_9FIRM|nr:Crp/Fnr family transcriptional regulator [Sedimentibacter saalensis]MEA5096295.1 Crp/Fnr family transcriptional regulator [Sedimentibacter saalensis]TWH83641.1 CRP/FNR family transcriptional regulator [Sedimentibacter saalensis]
MECSCKFNGLCTSKIALFSMLTFEEHNALISKSEHLDYKKGDIIFRESDPADKIIIVRYGRVKLNHYSMDGKEYVTDILVESDIYGEQNIFGGGKYDVNAVALEPTGVCIISQEDIQKMIMNRPEVGVKLLNVVGVKLSSANELIELLSINDAKSRLAGFLLYRNTRIKKELIELSRDDIAAYINLTRETISRKLNELEDEGCIQLDGHKKIKIINKEALREIYENRN